MYIFLYKEKNNSEKFSQIWVKLGYMDKLEII